MAKVSTLHAEAYRWLKKNPNELKKFPGKYVYVTGNGVSLTGDDHDEPFERAMKAGSKYPLILWAGVGFQEA